MKKFSLLTTIFFTFLFAVSFALAAVPKLIPYQGVLYDEQAMKPLDGVYSITFEIYDVPSGGTPIWTVNRSVKVEKGYFNVMLGEVNPLTNVNFNKQLYLQITVANGTPYPRTKLGATPYAIQAASAVDADTAKVAQNVVDGVLTWEKFNPAAIVAGGDLQGNYPNPTLRKGVVLENIEPGSITQKYLAPNVSVLPAGKAGGDLAGQYPDPLIAKGAVKTDRLADGAVTLEKMANNSISSEQIIDGEVYLVDLNNEVKEMGGDLDGFLPNPTVVGFQNVPVSATPALHGQVYMLYKPNPDAAPIWVASNAAGDVAGTYDNLQIQPGVVTSLEIADNTIVDADVNKNAAIKGTKIVPDFGFQDVITTGDVYADNANITNDIYATNIYASNALNTRNGTFDNLTVNLSTLLNGAVKINSNAEINGTINGVNNFVLDGEPLTSGDLDGSYPYPIIRENAVTTVKILNGAVTNPKLAADAVTTDKILNNTILEEDIADGQISTRTLAAGAVTNNIIAPDAVTNDKILDGTIVSADIRDGTIQTIDIGDGQITTAKLAAGAVTNNIIANDAVTSNKIMNGTIIDEDVNVAAGIQGIKINPNFGNQLVTTSGEVNARIVTADSTLQVEGSILNPGPEPVLVDDDMNVTGNLTVNGTINLNNVNATNVTADNGYFDNLWVYVSANIQGPIQNSNGNVLIQDDLDVTGDLFANDGTFSGNVAVTGNVTANNGTFTGTVSAAQFNGSLQYGVQAGNGLLGGTFNNTANNIFTVNEAYAFNWTGNQTWAGTATFNNGLNVNDTTMLNDDVVIGDAVTDVVTINGNTTVQGIIGGTPDFTVDGDVDINGGANVDGVLTVQTLNPYNLNVTNDLTVGNNTTLGNATTDWTLINGTMNFASNLNPTITFDGVNSVGIFTDGATNTLFLDGANAQFFAAGARENVIIDGAVGTITASAGATIGDDETVDLFSVRAATNILGNVTIGSITPPYGYQTLIQNDGSNTALSVTGAVTSATIPALDVNGDAYIANAGTFDNPSLDADLYVYSNLEVDGNVYLGDAATDVVEVTGNSTFNGTGEFISGDANWTLRAENTDAGRAAQFENNANSTTPAVEILNYGSLAGTMGLRIYNNAAGFGNQLLNVNSGVSSSASAAWFESMNTNLNEYAVGIRNTGDAPALYVDNQGTGRSALFVNTTNSTSPIVEIINYSNNAGTIGLRIQNDNTATNFDDQLLNVVVSGTNTKASAAWFEANNSDPNEYAVGIRNTGNSPSLYIDNQGTGEALYVNGHYRQGTDGRTILGFSQIASLANFQTATGTVIEYSDAVNVVLNSFTDFPNTASGTANGRVIYIINNTVNVMTINNLSGFTSTVNIQPGDMVGFIFVTDGGGLGSGWRLLNN